MKPYSFFNENLERLINSDLLGNKLFGNKKLLLLIPGIIVTVIAVVLLIMAVTMPQRTLSAEESSDDILVTHESLIHELVKTKEYLSQLEESISGSFNILTRDGMVDMKTTNGINADFGGGEWDEEVGFLQGNLSSLLLRIEQSNSYLDGLLASLYVAGGSSNLMSGEEVTRHFYELAETIAITTELYEITYEDVKTLLSQINMTNDGNHHTLQIALQGMVEKMEDGNTGNLTVLMTAISDSITHNEQLFELLTELTSTNQATIENHLSGINDKIGDDISDLAGLIITGIGMHDERVSERIGVLDDNIVDGLNELDAMFNESFTNQEIIIDSKFTVLNEKIEAEFNKLFQSVSNGKKLLATALLTKGQAVAADLDDVAHVGFQQFFEAILNIPLSIELNNMAGEIELFHHFHENHEGIITDELVLVNPGGCFHTDVTHLHIGQETGTDCYHFTVHIHTPAVAGTTTRQGCNQRAADNAVTLCSRMQRVITYCNGRWGSGWEGQCVYILEQGACSCGTAASSSTSVGNNPTGTGHAPSCDGPHSRNERPWYNAAHRTGPGFTRNCGNQPLNNAAILNCDNNEIIGFGLSCGWVSGQITGAMIRY
ncbi:MAG: hypothetical protein LBC96_01945 [Lachnospiraceae bacterium]|jgi:hypothetical protein|nr:hypothetical protein [Lachnospiraceae bacterium]